MSQTTFSQSPSATTGLTNYDLEPVPKELYPAPTTGQAKRKRPAAWRKRFLTRGRLHKEGTQMTHHTIEAMVDTLRKSVTTISGVNEDQAKLLDTSFSQFKTALTGEIDTALAKAAPEESLYKGLGCIGRVCDMVAGLARNVESIQRGYESWQMNNGQPPENADPASPELAEALDGLIAHAEGVMRMAVNEHCEPMDEGDDAGDMHVIMVPLHGTDGAVAVKSYLPEDLLKYATDPDALAVYFHDIGINALEMAGVDIEAMTKALGAGNLAKDAGMMGGDQATPDPAGGADIGDDTDPLDVMARLAALMMIVVDNLKQQVDGDGGASDPTGEDPATAAAAGGAAGDPAAAGGDAGGDPAATDDPANKNAPLGDLAKSIDDEALAKLLKARGIDVDVLAKLAEENQALKSAVAEMEELSKRLLAQPEAPKAPVVSGASLAKGAENDLAPGAPAQQDLSKLSPGDRAAELIKRQHATGGRPSSGVN